MIRRNIQFVKNQSRLGLYREPAGFAPFTRLQAFGSGLGLGLAAAPKMMYAYTRAKLRSLPPPKSK